VDVDSSLPPLVLPGRILNELCAHALETLPEECCGLILGAPQLRFRELVRCRNEMTRLHLADPHGHPRDGSTAFWMNESDYAHAHALADAAGQAVTAVYHSHVDVGAYLSELDLAYAEDAAFPFPGADQIVIAVQERRVVAAGLFQREGVGKPFVGRTVVLAAP
jgi:proteasome lid subunit RPN8/RPN11